MKTLQLLYLLIALVASSSSIAQIVYSEQPILSSDKEIVICVNEAHKEGMRYGFGREEFKNLRPKISVAVDPKKAFETKNALVLTEIVRKNHKAKSNFYIALVEPNASFEIPAYKDRPLFFYAEDFTVQAEMLVDSAKMNDPFFQELYLDAFMLYLASAERMEEDKRSNYYKAAFYLNEIDSLYFYSNDLASKFNTKILGSIVPNAVTIFPNEERPSNEPKSKGKKGKDPLPQVKKGNPFVSKVKDGEKPVLFHVIPFTLNGKAAIQKYMLSVERGLIYSDFRILQEGEKPELTVDDFQIFKILPSEKEKAEIRKGKISKITGK